MPPNNRQGLRPLWSLLFTLYPDKVCQELLRSCLRALLSCRGSNSISFSPNVCRYGVSIHSYADIPVFTHTGVAAKKTYTQQNRGTSWRSSDCEQSSSMPWYPASVFTQYCICVNSVTLTTTGIPKRSARFLRRSSSSASTASTGGALRFRPFDCVTGWATTAACVVPKRAARAASFSGPYGGYQGAMATNPALNSRQTQYQQAWQACSFWRR